MRIRRPRGVTVPQLMIVTAVGVLGGVYIWQPLLIKWKKENNAKESTKETVAQVAAIETAANFLQFMKQFAYTRVGIMAIGIISTLTLNVTYRFAVKPKLDGMRRREAESMADYIFQHEIQHSTPSNEKSF